MIQNGYSSTPEKSIEEKDCLLPDGELRFTGYFDILCHPQVNAIVLGSLAMNMYYCLYSGDEYENEFVEVVTVYYDNDGDFVLLIDEYNILRRQRETLGCYCARQ